jgi:flagellar biogenesis protein FliO
MIDMILTRNPLEIVGGVIGCLAFIYYGIWMFRQLMKDDPNMREFKE